MKGLFCLLFSMTFSWAGAQSFYLSTPEGWHEELIAFPIEFAPSIAYQGEEHLRFPPGWGQTKSEEFWSYCYLWWIGEDAIVTKQSLEKDLKAYYDGLVGRNIISRKIDSTLVVPTVVEFQPLEKGKNMAFKGTVKMLDYMGARPIVLNIEVSVTPCTKEKKKAVFVAVSPQSASHKIWTQFKSVRETFRCAK